MSIGYAHDILAWANEQAAFLRAGQWDRLDIDHLADEIEDVGKSEQRELMSRVAVLLAHLLKWQVQPQFRGRSGQRTIRDQRRAIALHLQEVPSFKSRLRDPNGVERVWLDTVTLAAQETRLTDLPESMPWALHDALQPNWLPPEELG